MILLPTRCHQFPQFFGVATGSVKAWFLRSRDFKDGNHCHWITVLVKWRPICQCLGLPQYFGLIALKEVHFVDGHRHRIHVACFCRSTAFEPSRIQQFWRGPTHGVGRRCLRCGGRVRETSTTAIGDEDSFLHQSKFRNLKTGVEIILLSGRHERDPCCEDTEDRVRHPLAVTGLSQGGHKTKHSSTY